MGAEELEVRPLHGAGERACLYDLRARVLRPGRPPEESRFAGDDDPDAVHLGAFVRGRCVGVATLLPDGGLRLRGMAVEPDLQGRGIGAALVRRAQETAARAGQDLWCNARASAAGFYRKLGWVTEGDAFDVPGIGPHFVMRWLSHEKDRQRKQTLMSETNALPLTLDAAHLAPDITPEQIAAWRGRLAWAQQTLLEGTGAGADFRGWLDPAAMVDDGLLGEIEAIAADLRERSDVLVVIGIGGSYLGARAVIEALAPAGASSVVFAGQNLSARYHADLLGSLQGKRVALNAVSKSGTTTEPAVAFRLLRAHVEAQAGPDEAKNLIVATTDARKGAMRTFADTRGYRTLPIADDVGGRYSVLSPVGLLAIAYAGIDIRALRAGAGACAAAAAEPDPLKNPVLFYAAARNLLYNQGYATEVLASFEPRLHYLMEWWKQLFGESEGKDHMALYPSSVAFTTDLHSMGQYLQQGRRDLIETFLWVEGEGEPVLPLPPGDDADELGYLAGRPLTEINRAAYQATALAHREGGVPNLTVRLPRLDAHALGGLLYFFERACGVSGYLLGVNPFDQPGVEAYKQNMFALLRKPGYEAETGRLREAVDARPGGSLISFG